MKITIYEFYQKNRNYIIIGGIVIIIAFLAWFIFSVRPDNQRGTVSAVNNDITETRRNLERADKLTGELAKDNIAFAKKFILDALQDLGVIGNDGWNEVGNLSDKYQVDRNDPHVDVYLKEVE
mgnify:CR=1 FL=1